MSLIASLAAALTSAVSRLAASLATPIGGGTLPTAASGLCAAGARRCGVPTASRTEAARTAGGARYRPGGTRLAAAITLALAAGRWTPASGRPPAGHYGVLRCGIEDALVKYLAGAVRL